MARIDFPVNITKQTVGVSRRGFGTILVFDNTQDIELKIFNQEDLKDLEKDGKLFKLLSRLFMQKPQPQQVKVIGKKVENTGIADALYEVLNEDKDFFFIMSTANDVESVKVFMEFAGVNDKIYATTVNTMEDAKALYEEVSENSIITYHDDKDAFLGEGLAVIMSYDTGEISGKFKQVIGVKECKINDTDLAELEKNNIFTYIRKLGELQTTEGTVKSGEYIDIVLAEYWIKFRMEEDAMYYALNNKKISYTNQGIAGLVGVVERVLNQAVDKDLIVDGQYKIEYKKREDVSPNDVANRTYNDIQWVAQLSGAIHSGIISGVLTYENVMEVDA